MDAVLLADNLGEEPIPRVPSHDSLRTRSMATRRYRKACPLRWHGDRVAGVGGGADVLILHTSETGRQPTEVRRPF